MKNFSIIQNRLQARPGVRRWDLVLILALMLPGPLLAFPPTPHHLIVGQVRDEMGEPISIVGAKVIFETTNAIPVQTVISPSIRPGLNFEMRVPMDAGIKPDLYKPNALKTDALFRLKVVIGNTVYLPIEMVGDFSLLGQPAQQTRIDLTLGEDSDGDGLPDAWERALIAALGGGLTLQDILPGDDADGDGLTNLQEYLAGTYAFDAEDGFFVSLTQIDENATTLEFLTIRGRTYSMYASTDLNLWSPVAFTIPSEGSNAPLRNNYQAPDVRILQVAVPHGANPEANRYFKALVE